MADTGAATKQLSALRLQSSQSLQHGDVQHQSSQLQPPQLHPSQDQPPQLHPSQLQHPQAFPAATRHASGLVGGEMTVASSIAFADWTVVTLSQGGAVSQWVSGSRRRRAR
jgi:hypothetical protein